MSYAAMFALLNVAGVTGHVSERIKPQYIPQAKGRPALTYALISQVRHSAMGVDTGLVTSRYQTNAFDPSYVTASTLREAVRAATQRQRGTFGGVVVEDVLIDGAQDLYDSEPEDASGGRGEHQLTLDILMWHRES